MYVSIRRSVKKECLTVPKLYLRFVRLMVTPHARRSAQTCGVLLQKLLQRRKDRRETFEIKQTKSIGTYVSKMFRSGWTTVNGPNIHVKEHDGASNSYEQDPPRN
ncbi:MAG: hypothetical protein EZS28_026057 [Streblomastix strix]|uniref:Uncharacterized protein n=1 Tax=Streblomastix strix TaxID=222440 RepID=A0A5J4V7H6_9EUKA|nr:MAG: hypothetical protein EZS28_026057 [Streblomastix strix]